MAGKLRLGVIGAGSWAVASHLPNLQQRFSEVEPVAVARKGKDLLGKIQQRFGFAVASEDYRDVINEGIDICVVSSPAALHHQHARAALESGAHVLVEKPMTVAPAQAWDLVRIAEDRGLHLLCSFGWNYRPMLVKARELFEREGVGEVEQLNITMSSSTRELLSRSGGYPDASPETAVDPDTWTDPALSGGGYAQAQLTHALGLALWLTGLAGASAFALMRSVLSAPVELYDACVISYSNGAIGTLAGGAAHSGFDGDKHQLDIRVIGSDGQFLCDLQREAVWLYRPGGSEVRLELQPGDAAYDCAGPPNALVDLALGRPGAVNRSPGWLGARTVEILDAVYRSSRSGQLERVASSGQAADVPGRQGRR